MCEDPGTVERLVELGFSHYEARAYIGLLGSKPLTGYALSNAIGIPQPKVYETLRRLARKGVALMFGGEPARFIALPPTQLIAQLDESFRRRLKDVKSALTHQSVNECTQLRVVERMSDWHEIEALGIEALEAAVRYACVSLNVDDVEGIADAIRRADTRGIHTDALLFGKRA